VKQQHLQLQQAGTRPIRIAQQPPKMPRPQHPLTPASSAEIRGKDGHFSSLQMSFELPPSAVAGMDSRPSTATTKSSASSYHPTSPTSPAIPASEAVKLRRRSSVAQNPNKEAFALPPPPTRSRKIIQMKPRGQAEEESQEVGNDAGKNAGGKTTSATKKKQPSSTSVAGRKIARKTAHSLIERRRRSKMNEEFGVLKDMIPACTGEMHKLAILQASIDYVRYLEDCVAKLKAENNRTNSTSTLDQFALPPAKRGSYSSPRQYPAFDGDEDVEMSGSSESVSPTHTIPLQTSHPSLSPALPSQDSHNHQNPYSSISTDQRHCSYSSTTSPALGPGAYDYARSVASAGSTLTSPALLPQRDMDQEATAALLMLNTERRGTNGGSGRGMSVKDLLST